ncbi:MAG TPA: lysophospholipid acyltransferase family protein [Terracidiphilus sp.]|nr:lysophospholipid acyltransferase family protein [Terracidiphilus sp.]
MIRALILLFTIILLGAPAALLFIPWAIVTGNVLPLYNASLAIVRIGYRLVGIRIQVTGLDNVPPHTACIFMANHVSNLDPPALLPRIPGRTSAFVKKSLMKIPVFGWGLKLGEFIPVSRDGSVIGAQESVAAARSVLQHGIHITTFVEGTRSLDGRMLRFKKGPFYLAMQTGAPCIPVSIYGTEALMAKGSNRIHPGTAYLVFHPPIYPANFATREELMAAVRASIASALPEWMRT